MLAKLRSKNLHTWMRGYARHLARNLVSKARARKLAGPRHVLFALCDHYEPLWGKTTVEHGEERVRAWSEGYPRMADAFRDSDGKPPRHSFFFPGEEYAPQYLEALAELARGGYGEVELHLHHDDDTAENLRRDINHYLEIFAKHGHISRDGDGSYRYAFIHGNWCLANSRADGRWCGVDEELPLLFDTGCYADLTFPSAPDECQPDHVNEIYWPQGDLGRKRSYEGGLRARVGEPLYDRLLMITGPLAFTRRPGSLKPRIESAAIDAHDPPSAARVDSWIDANVHIAGRPEWVFVKLHTHGAPESNAKVLLGQQIAEMHQQLTTQYNDQERWQLHYVTAREMYNIAAAAIDGRSGNPNEFRDYMIEPPPVCQC